MELWQIVAALITALGGGGVVVKILDMRAVGKARQLTAAEQFQVGIIERLEKVEGDLKDAAALLRKADTERHGISRQFEILRLSYAVFRAKVKKFIHYWQIEQEANQMKPSSLLEAIATDLSNDDHQIDELLGSVNEGQAE